MSRRASEESLGMKTLTHFPRKLSKSHPGFIRGIPNITKEPLPTPHCYSCLRTWLGESTFMEDFLKSLKSPQSFYHLLAQTRPEGQSLSLWTGVIKPKPDRVRSAPGRCHVQKVSDPETTWREASNCSGARQESEQVDASENKASRS